MLKKNDEIELEIESFTSEGSGVGRYEGMAVFVGGSAAGDRVLAHIIKVKQNYAVAKTLRILRPSENRIPSDCAVSDSCGGCAFRHISYSSEIEMKRDKIENAFRRIGGTDKSVDSFIEAEELTHYRNKAEYPVGFNGRLNIGFYARHTHRIVDCEKCVLSAPEFSDIVGIIRKWIIEFGIPVYDGESGTGLLRHIFLRKAFAAGEIMLCLVINGDSIPRSRELLERVLVIPGIKSVVLNINKNMTNVILGTQCVTLWGEDYIFDELCGVRVRLSPLSFYQINRAQAEKLYGKAAEFADLDGSETVLDLYCGAGTIGLSMADKAKRIIGVEIVADAVEDAKFNAKLNGIDNAEFYCMDASAAAKMLKDRAERPEVVILDPPRKGCSRELIDAVGDISPERIVYVSCDPATLARDCKLFSQYGYKVQKLAGVDLFPRTVHVESVALLIK